MDNSALDDGTYDWVYLNENECGVSKSIMIVEFSGKGRFDLNESYLVGLIQMKERLQAKYAKPN